jgi:hypothetical protein
MELEVQGLTGAEHGERTADRLNQRTDTHLYVFTARGLSWGIPDPDGGFGDEPIDARKARLYDIVRETGAKTIHYLYDFGDGWDHVIKIEKQFNDTVVMGMPFLLDAGGRCPPEVDGTDVMFGTKKARGRL